jgi:hypothetical protein
VKLHQICLPLDALLHDFPASLNAISLPKSARMIQWLLPKEAVVSLTIAGSCNDPWEIEERLLAMIPYDLDEIHYVTSRHQKTTAVWAVPKKWITGLVEYSRERRWAIEKIGMSDDDRVSLYAPPASWRDARLLLSAALLAGLLFLWHGGTQAIHHLKEADDRVRQTTAPVRDSARSIRSLSIKAFSGTLRKTVAAMPQGAWLDEFTFGASGSAIKGYCKTPDSKSVFEFVRQLRTSDFPSANLRAFQKIEDGAGQSKLHFEIGT